MDNNKTKSLLLCFDHPLRSICAPRGINNSIFDVPQNYIPNGTKSHNKNLKPCVYIKELTKLPNIQQLCTLPRNENFSLFIEKHYKLATLLTDIFFKAKTIDDLISIAVYVHDYINPYLYNYALSVAVTHRKDTRNVKIPTFAHLFPHKFISSKLFMKASHESLTGLKFVEIKETASDANIEHKLAYFREDLGINLHHWHWHLVYPAQGLKEIVNKNRRGELFYYMHQQILARYNMERLCNKMNRVVSWHFTTPIEEAYFPKLYSAVEGANYPPRVSNQSIQNLDKKRENIRNEVIDLVKWRERIMYAIYVGYVIDEHGNKIKLTNDDGIDILGNIVESCMLSPNSRWYGNLHNVGHLFIGYIHDPDDRYLESIGVMGDTATALRDPVFYRWHSFIDSIFQEFKSTLTPYNRTELIFDKVYITRVKIQTKKEINILKTFWEQSEIDLCQGFNFQTNDPITTKFTYLQHEEFVYTINVYNSGIERTGTCRIFIAPKLNEHGTAWLLSEQKNFFIELDRFQVKLQTGRNIIPRSSSDSSVTIPFEQTYGNNSADQLFDNYCGCGWPDNMLVAKGNSEGYACQLFVMISNYEQDKVNGACKDKYSNESYCGVKNSLYPDKRSMGFPFDRMPSHKVDKLKDFIRSYKNMAIIDCTIEHKDETRNRPDS